MLKTVNKLFLAPLDKVNCAAFRLLCKKHGAGLVSTEMIDTHAFLRNNERFYWYKKERPLLVQFIGNEPEFFKECIKTVKDCDVLDLNAGCPSDDQTDRGCGAALLKDLPRLKKIVETLVKYSPCDVSVKCRMGWDKDESIKIARVIEKAGADFLTIHPRTKFEGYGTPAKWDVIKKVKIRSKIPVFASGDLLDELKVSECIKETKCNGVMIARGAINNPFIFKDSQYYIKTGKVRHHSVKSRLGLIDEFIKLYKKYDTYDLSELRNHSAWLVKDVPYAAKLRDIIGKSKDEASIISTIRTYLKENSI